MAFTYTSTSSTFLAGNLGWVRTRLGDTDSSDPLLTDEQINALLSDYGNKLLATKHAALSIAAKFARRIDTKMGKLDQKWSQLQKHYTSLAMELDTELAVDGATPWAGGQSVDDKDSRQDDSDRVKPSFARGMFAVEQTSHGEVALLSSGV